MKRYWQWILALGALLTFAGWHTTTAHAEGVGYTVSAKLPKNQDDKNVTYFALRVKPNQQEKLGVVISNQSKKSATFQYGVNQAITNNNGVIDYSNSNPKLDSSLKVGIKDVFNEQKLQKVTVPAKTSKTVYVTYKDA